MKTLRRQFETLLPTSLRLVLVGIAATITVQASGEQTIINFEGGTEFPEFYNNLSEKVSSQANDAETNLLKGIHSLLGIFESSEATALKEFAIALGVNPSIRQFTLADSPMAGNYSFELKREFNSGKLAEMLQGSIIPSLEQTDSYFAKVPANSVITLTQDLTGSEEPVTVDHTDV